jgi:uncharacterized protein DUF1592/uncharacterized protein DUF1588/uncharacterized protein DUF1585/uncharacterized protein DUF1587/uncharacterized protein DUF1595
MDAFVEQLEARLDASEGLRPGHAAPRRLNRAEYGAAVRDLLSLEIDASQLLPADDSNRGFDNAADSLIVSPALMEAYLKASRTLSRLAVASPEIPAGFSTYRTRADLGQDYHIEGLPAGTRGGIAARHNFPLDAEYILRTKLAVNTSAKVRGLDFPHEFLLVLDGRAIHRATIGGPEDEEAASQNATNSEIEITKRLEARVRIPAGPHTVGATFLDKTGALADTVLEPFSRTSFDTQEQRGIPIVDSLNIGGPFDATGAGDTPSRRKIFTCRPAAPFDEFTCAGKILRALARQAYRRPIDVQDMEPLLSMYQLGRNQADAKSPRAFEAGIESGIRFLLTSPAFLFRSESSPKARPASGAWPVSDVDLASRLSFFLWSSLPDETLLGLAESGKLRAPGELERQVRRMLADPRAFALTQNFAGQWLYLRNLHGVSRDLETFPNFDDNLRQGFRRETELFFDSIVREDRSVLDLLDADYTFVNERLAAHYGIAGVSGSQFRRVSLEGSPRRGLLGQGSILTVTSYATRTSPVLRGKWLLENILGAPVPPPPPGVPALAKNKLGAKPRTVRERLEEHRKNPACAVCHNLMDPLGFALENYDATGAWRKMSETREAIDAAGMLVDGTKVDGPDALRRAILDRPDTVARTVTEKMLTYALGRGLAHTDMPTVRAIVRASAPSRYRFSSLVVGIVNSVPFQLNRTTQATKEFARQ